jgi:hypothetical protein
MIFTCANSACSQAFKSYEHDAKYCCVKCRAEDLRSVDAAALKRLAFTGATATEIARELGTSRPAVHAWLRRFGLYEMWREQRYA